MFTSYSVHITSYPHLTMMACPHLTMFTSHHIHILSCSNFTSHHIHILSCLHLIISTSYHVCISPCSHPTMSTSHHVHILPCCTNKSSPNLCLTMSTVVGGTGAAPQTMCSMWGKFCLLNSGLVSMKLRMVGTKLRAVTCQATTRLNGLSRHDQELSG